LRPIVLLLVAAPAGATEPSVRAVSVRGLQLSAPTTVTIDGDDLGKAPKLLLPFPAKQALGEKNTDKQATFTVTPDAPVAPGVYHLRVVTDGGVSLPTVIAVDALPQRPFAPDAGALPAALHGAVGGSQVLETTFAGTAGQKVIVEVEAQRLGSKLRPVVHLYTAKRLQLAWAWGVPDLLGDARLEATLPEAGTYTVTLHDAEYAAGAPGFFRLKLGQWQTADLVFPPVAGSDTKAVELIGAGPPVRVELPTQRIGGPLAWPAGGAWSGPRPVLEISPRAERTAEPTGDTPVELPAGPVGVSARFAAPFAEHRYKVPVEPKSKVRFEVFAERYRFPVDAALVVRDDKGTQLARAEDGPGTLDPVLEYAVPEKVTHVIVGVVETQGRAGPRAAYRLAVDPGAVAVKDFRVFTPAQRLSLPAGGRGVLPVFADRRGFVGPITLAPTGLPAGWTATGTTIPADADGALVTLTRSDAAADATVTSWTGNDRPLTVKGHALERFQPWLAAEVAAAPVAGKADVAIDWNALPEKAALAPPFKLKLPVKVTRPDPAAPVRLTLLTSQNPPLANNQPDAAKAIRAEKAVELGAKAADGELVALVPPELPADGYDLAVQAEVLSADKQRVLATAVTTVRRLPVRLPVAVKLDGGAAITATLDAKVATVVELKGEVTRAEGFAGDAVVALAGLPPGATAPPVTVKAGETKFALKLTVPPTTPAGDVRGLKLSASAAPDPAQAAVRVKSRDTDIVLTLRPGAKTP
jgi:hypothetical protein